MKNPSLKNLTSKTYGDPVFSSNEILKEFGKPHIDSFDYAVSEGLQSAVKNLLPVEFETASKTRIKLQITNATIHPPKVQCIGRKIDEIYPLECKQRGITYSGMLEIGLNWYINSEQQLPLEINLAKVPIMIMSKLCNLRNLSPKELVNNGEQVNEWGGYFIIKGKERLLRMLLKTRRNYPIAMSRSSWKNRDTNFSASGIYIHCVSEDQTTNNNVLHFLTDGTAKLMVAYRKNLFYLPIFLVIKCLVPYDDIFIFQCIMSGYEGDQYLQNCIIEMMRSLKENEIKSQNDARNYIGELFRVKCNHLPSWATNDEICQFVIENCVLIHLKTNEDKFHLLILMLQKLFLVTKDKCLYENPDSIMFQELLLGGHLFLKILKEKLQMFLYALKAVILKHDKSSFILTERDLSKFSQKVENIESSLENFFATGNLISPSGLGLQQDKGLSIMVENISIMRYMSHFRGVHRGAIFEEMRTTEPRQLLPDAWGFICPVHTPDGTPCGLLNHLTRTCQVVNTPHGNLLNELPIILTQLGMTAITLSSLIFETNLETTERTIKRKYYVVVLDGCIIGHVLESMMGNLVDNLRYLKILGKKVPQTLEIVFLPYRSSETINQFPGLYLFTNNARMMRPVLNILFNEIELIGSFEQVYLQISVSYDKIIPGKSTHVELQKSDFLSFAASLIPLPDYNQSPRNMYQCQMGKQTMGTACHNWQQRSDAKLYRLQTPASPLFRPIYYDLLSIDDYPMGTNAVIAVISYTGYDMEDAMIINKSALERGFAHGCVYKCNLIELNPGCYFQLDPTKDDFSERLDKDGLPFIGAKIKPGDVYYCYYDSIVQEYTLGRYNGKEEVFIDTVRLCGDFITGQSNGQAKLAPKASVLFRIPRNPSVGDKFASRAGQKGIFSIAYQTENLPFTESGLVPDIVFNPHGFPSRMTIAMMIECMAGKSAAMHGMAHNASPFQFSESESVIDYFGKMLEASGYNYYGIENMYSGIDGKILPTSIFCGIVHYQRLRHMVSDKWQVRSTGPVDVITRQPLKGRKRGGGGRVGEMERDALISHGASYLLQDRLLDCSDKSTTNFCRTCKTIIGPTIIMEKCSDGINVKRNISICKLCNSSKNIQEIGIPYIFKYLCAELASVNINLKFDIIEENGTSLQSNNKDT